MTDQIKEAFLEYEELKLQEKKIAERITELKPVLFEAVPKDEEFTAKFGTFSIRPTSTWKYSEAVKALQEEEKAKGIAEKVTTEALVYTAFKNK